MVYRGLACVGIVTQNTRLTGLCRISAIATIARTLDFTQSSFDIYQLRKDCRAVCKESESLDLHTVLPQCVTHLASCQTQYPRCLRLDPTGFLHGIDKALAFSCVIRRP